MTSTSDESLDPERHPLDEPVTTDTTTTTAPTTAPTAGATPVAVRRSRGLGVNRHLGSVVLSCLAVLGAYCALDYGFYRANAAAQVNLDQGALPDRTMIWLGVAA